MNDREKLLAKQEADAAAAEKANDKALAAAAKAQKEAADKNAEAFADFNALLARKGFKTQAQAMAAMIEALPDA